MQPAVTTVKSKLRSIEKSASSPTTAAKRPESPLVPHRTSHQEPVFALPPIHPRGPYKDAIPEASLQTISALLKSVQDRDGREREKNRKQRKLSVETIPSSSLAYGLQVAKEECV